MKLPWRKPQAREAAECWCGAKAGAGCLNRDGSPAVTTHATRGQMDRLTMDAVVRTAGLEPLLTPAERKLLERRARSRGKS